MRNDNDFLILAERDYDLCLRVEKDFPKEYAISAASYHIEQAIEKLLKGLILVYGETPEYTHNIAKLKVHAKNIGIELPNDLEELADTLTMWEATVRYDPFIDFSQSKYDRCKCVYEELYEMLSYEIDRLQNINNIDLV